MTSFEARFEAKVDRTSEHHLWTGAKRHIATETRAEGSAVAPETDGEELHPWVQMARRIDAEAGVGELSPETLARFVRILRRTTAPSGAIRGGRQPGRGYQRPA